MKLIESLYHLILEAASINDIRQSIEKKQVCTIYYTGDEPGGRGLREIEPLCLGYSKANNLVLRAWDITGASHTGYLGSQPLPGWRLFRVDRIGNYSVNPLENFTEPRPLYNPDDKGMVGLKICAKFELEDNG